MAYIILFIEANGKLNKVRTPKVLNELPEVKKARMKAFVDIMNFVISDYGIALNLSECEEKANEILELLANPILSLLNEACNVNSERVPVDSELFKAFGVSNSLSVSLSYVLECIQNKTNLFFIQEVNSINWNLIETVPIGIATKDCIAQLDFDEPNIASNGPYVLFDEGIGVTFTDISNCFSSSESALKLITIKLENIIKELNAEKEKFENLLKL